MKWLNITAIEAATQQESQAQYCLHQRFLQSGEAGKSSIGVLRYVGQRLCSAPLSQRNWQAARVATGIQLGRQDVERVPSLFLPALLQPPHHPTPALSMCMSTLALCKTLLPTPGARISLYQTWIWVQIVTRQERCSYPSNQFISNAICNTFFYNFPSLLSCQVFVDCLQSVLLFCHLFLSPVL